MKHKLLIALGLIVLGMVIFAAIPAMAINGYGINTAMPSWNQTLNSYYRFIVLTNMKSEAVWDRETGLVWERSPSTVMKDWENAIEHCYKLNLGGRGGFRLPTVEELRTLIDPNEIDPALPTGHPFNNVQSNYYWSSTTVAGSTTNAWNADMYYGLGHNSFNKTQNFYVWCVRGGHGYDGQ